MPENLAAYLLIVLAITVSPGPDTVLVIGKTTRYGLRTGVLTAFGSAAGLLVWGVAAAMGVATVITASADGFAVLKVVGAVYLLLLGARMVHASFQSSEAASIAPVTPGRPPAHSWAQGLGTNLANPKAAAFFTAVLPQFVTSASDVFTATLAYAGIAALASLLGLVTYALIAQRAGIILGTRRATRVIERVAGTVLIGLGVRLAFADAD
jgi:threonine/homoserine/homoserine lactone efflux protein